jgi:hypothetical protein
MKTPNASLICRKIHDDVVILNPATGVCYTLKQAGAEIWNGLDRRDDVETIVQRICERYMCDAAEARRDVIELLADLEREGLIV